MPIPLERKRAAFRRLHDSGCFVLPNPWDAGSARMFAAMGFKGGLAMESFINMPAEVAYGLAVWRPVARDMEEVMGNGLPFLRNKAKQYGLI